MFFFWGGETGLLADGVGTEVAVADAAVEAAVGFAVGAAQLDESLGCEGVAAWQAGIGEGGGEAVGLRGEGFEEFDGLATLVGDAGDVAVGEFECGSYVDGECGERLAAECLRGVLVVWVGEVVVVLPVAGEGGAEYGVDVGGCGGFEQAGMDARAAVDDGCEECYTAVWKARGTHARHFPGGGAHGAQAEFVGHEAVFAAEGVDVGIGGCCGVEQSALAEEEGFDGEEVVGVMAEDVEGCGECEALEAVAVDAESECPREGDVGYAFPVGRQGAVEAGDAVGALVKALVGEGLCPGGEVYGLDGGYTAGTRE